MTLLLALLAPASAFAPSDTVHIGIEPHRVLLEHPEEQLRHLRSEAWQRFVATDGAGWQARFDEATSTPRWLWGAGIPMPSEPAAQVNALVDLLERHRDLLGIGDGQLALRAQRHVDRVDTTYLELEVLRGGLPTYRGVISARIKHGKLVMLVNTAPELPVTGALTLTAGQAIDAAIGQGPAPSARHTAAEAVPMLLERRDLDGLTLRTTWQVTTRTQDPPGIWVSFVDGATGELLSVHNEVRFITGQVQAEHHARTLDGSPLVTSPLPLAEVVGDADAGTTDEAGDYTLAASGTFTTSLAGEYLTVLNAVDAEGLIVSGSPDITWTDADASQSEIDSYVFLHHVKAWGEEVAPEVGMSWDPLTAWVDIPDVCNAYYDGNVNFFLDGGGCNNTGQIADVNYHEWGHGFHGWSLEAGFWDGSLGEGAADVVAFFQTGDSHIGPYFFPDGGAIRDVAPDAVYPDDYVASEYYVHTNGLIFGGAMWDLWDVLVDELGEEAGTAATERIFTGLLKGGPDVPGSFYEALVADDADGDLANGTPNVCAIVEAFGRHGLGTGEVDGVVLAQHEPLEIATGDGAHIVELELLDVGEGCVPTTATSGTVHWRTDGGPWQTAPLAASATGLSGAIPAQPLGSFVEYWVSGVGSSGADFSVPGPGEAAPYSFYVGGVIEVHCDDFEAGDGGYTHSLVAGEEQEGADDWQWGVPTGASGDPVSAFSGQKVWGNDLGHDNYNGAYQADKTNRLESPELATGHYTDVFLHYRRWLQVEDGFYDQARILADGDEVWTNHGTVELGDAHHQDGTWVAHAVDLGGRADQGTVRIAWELSSDGGLELGGWTVDDVCLMAAATADNRLGITDFRAEAQGDTSVALTWTHPAHRPVERVVVVRNRDHQPTGHDDGEVVFDRTDVAVGEAVTAMDQDLVGGHRYYAVYASDGEEWLSWTVEGWNADDAEIVGGPGPFPGGSGGSGDDEVASSDVPPGGCGCSSVGGSIVGSAWLVALGAGLVGVRRRRRPRLDAPLR